jgi:preprotein translocase subunit YajC
VLIVAWFDDGVTSDYSTPAASAPPGTQFLEHTVSAPILSNDLLLAQNVQPRATGAATPGASQDSSPLLPSSGSSGSSPLSGLLPIVMMIVIFVPFLFLMSRRQKKEATARAALKKGDRVTTTAGLIGELVEMDDRIAKVKVAPGVTLQIVANTVSPFAESDKTQAKELKEAKVTSDKK